MVLTVSESSPDDGVVKSNLLVDIAKHIHLPLHQLMTVRYVSWAWFVNIWNKSSTTSVRFGLLMFAKGSRIRMMCTDGCVEVGAVAVRGRVLLTVVNSKKNSCNHLLLRLAESESELQLS